MFIPFSIIWVLEHESTCPTTHKRPVVAITASACRVFPAFPTWLPGIYHAREDIFHYALFCSFIFHHTYTSLYSHFLRFSSCIIHETYGAHHRNALAVRRFIMRRRDNLLFAVSSSHLTILPSRENSVKSSRINFAKENSRRVMGKLPVRGWKTAARVRVRELAFSQPLLPVPDNLSPWWIWDTPSARYVYEISTSCVRE